MKSNIVRHFVEARTTEMAMTATEEGDMRSPDWQATVRAYAKFGTAFTRRVNGHVNLWMQGCYIDIIAIANGRPGHDLAERKMAEIFAMDGTQAPPGLEAIW